MKAKEEENILDWGARESISYDNVGGGIRVDREKKKPGKGHEFRLWNLGTLQIKLKT